MKRRLPSGTGPGPGLAIHHIGYAVGSIEKALRAFYTPCLGGVGTSEVFHHPIQRVRVAFVEMAGGRVELVEPASVDSPVTRILSGKRGGLYHVGFSAERFEESVERLSGNGCRVISGPSPPLRLAGDGSYSW